MINLINPTPLEKAKMLFFLLKSDDTQHEINTLENLKTMLEQKKIKKEEKAANECKIINTYNRNPFTAKRISMIDINDPIFEKPIQN